MTIDRCPGMDHKAWGDKSIFEVPCPHCGQAVEMWTDDAERTCSACGKTVPNPNAGAKPPAESAEQE